MKIQTATVFVLVALNVIILGKPAPPVSRPQPSVVGPIIRKNDRNTEVQSVNRGGAQPSDAAQLVEKRQAIENPEPENAAKIKNKVKSIEMPKEHTLKNIKPSMDLSAKSLKNRQPDDLEDDNIARVDKDSVKFVKIPDGIDKISVDKLRPVDHMDAVKMEQDGHINKDYHREMFLGNHEEFENSRYEEAESKLKDIVYKVDTDQDGLLSVPELEAWVIRKMEEHFAEAVEENDEIFKHLDPDGNGKVHWKEYYIHFLLAKGFEKQQAEKHVVDYDEIVLDPDSKEELIRYKFRWSDADTDPLDNELTPEEFMSFRHPEQSDKTLNNMVVSIMSGIDANGDGVITEDEFTMLPPGEVEGEEFQAMDRNWQKERQEEFRKSMDVNHDGKVVKDELKKYLDPRNPVQALMEAKNIISFIDDNHDEKLSMEEILRHKDIFISSKVMNFAANVHDEF